MRIRSVITHSTQAILEGAIIASLVVGLMAGTTLAGKDGGHGKPGGGSTSGATLVVTPATVAGSGTTFTVSGSGYGAGKMVNISMANPGCCVAFPVASDASGNIWFQSKTGSAGTYVVKSYTYGTTSLLASTSFTVTSQ